MLLALVTEGDTDSIFDVAITILEEEDKFILHCFSIFFLDARTMRIYIS